MMNNERASSKLIQGQLVSLKYNLFSETVKRKNRCLKCCLTSQYCVCEYLHTLKTGSNNDIHKNKQDEKRLTNIQQYYYHGSLQLEIFIFMHYRERFRASNTGKIIYTICNDDDDNDMVDLNSTNKRRLWGADVGKTSAQYIINDIEDDEKRVISLLESDRYNPQCIQFILFPSQTAKPIADIIKNHREMTAVISSSSNAFINKDNLTENSLKVMRIIVLDGTWNQARRMYKKFPSWVPCCCLSHLTISDFLLRSQSQLGRVSTVEAVELLFEEIFQCFKLAIQTPKQNILQECHVNSDNDHDSFFLTAAVKLHQGLNALVSNVLKQSNKEVYASYIKQRNANCKLPAQW